MILLKLFDFALQLVKLFFLFVVCVNARLILLSDQCVSQVSVLILKFTILIFELSDLPLEFSNLLMQSLLY